MIESKGTLTQNDFTTPMDSPFQTIETFMKPEVKSENIKPIEAQLLEQFNISLHLLPPPVKPIQNVVTNTESSVDRNNHINLQETLHSSAENEPPSDVSELFSELTTTTNSPTLKPKKVTKEETKSFNSSNPAHISDVDEVLSSPDVTKEKAHSMNIFTQCPGESLKTCIAACLPLADVPVYGVCVRECTRRCP